MVRNPKIQLKIPKSKPTSFNFDVQVKNIKILALNLASNERHSNKTVNIFIVKTIYFILQNMFRSLHTSSSVVHIKSTVNVQIIEGL